MEAYARDAGSHTGPGTATASLTVWGVTQRMKISFSLFPPLSALCFLSNK